MLQTKAQTELDNKEVQFWNNKFEMCVQLRRPFEEQWYTNLAYYLGRQWIVWNKTSTGITRLLEPPVDNTRVRLVINKIKTYIRREHTKLTKEEPIWYAKPATTEPKDISIARCAQALTEYILDESSFTRVRSKATFWTCITGTGYIKVICDSKNAPIILEAPSPWEIFVPYLQQQDMESQTFVIHARGVPADTVKNLYGVDVSEDATSAGATLEQKLFTSLGITSAAAARQKLAYIKEIYVKPGVMSDYPDGATLVLCNNKIIYRYKYSAEEEAELQSQNAQFSEIPLEQMILEGLNALPQLKPTNYPYRHGMFPFLKFSHIPAGRFYACSIIEDLIPIQRELNKTRSQIVEVKNLTAKPMMMYTQGAINPKLLVSKPGLLVAVRPGFEPPVYLTQPDLPSYVLQEVEQLKLDMNESSSQFEVTRGSAPPGVEAASAIAYLQEENDSILHETISSIEEGIKGVGRQCLSLAQQFWSQEKILEIVSKNAATDAQIFKTGDLKGFTDVRVEPGSIAPISRAARQAFITGLIKDGIIPPERGLRYLQMNETDRLYEELQVDSRHAQRENYEMTHDNVIMAFPVNPWDNHEIHIYEHGLFLKSQEFELLDLQKKQVVVNHWLAHKGAMDLDVRRSSALANSVVQPSVESGRSEYSSASSIPAGATQ